MIKPDSTTKSLFLIFLLAFLLFSLTWHGSFYGYEREIFDASRNLMSEGRFSESRGGMVSVLSYIPFVLLSNLLESSAIATLAVVFYSALSVAIFYLLSTLFFSRKTTRNLSILFASATMVWPYSVIGMEHMLLLTALFTTYCLVKYKESASDIWLFLAGTSAALTMLTKAYGIIFVLGAIIFLLYSKKQHRIHVFLIPVLIGFCVYLLNNFLSTGHWLSGTYQPDREFVYVSLLYGVYGFLFSFGKSLFIYNPILLSALPGWKHLIQKEKAAAILFLSTIVSFTLLQAPFTFWTDETWGPRKLLLIIPYILLPLGYELERWKLFSAAKKALTAVVIIISIGVQVLGVSYDYGKQLKILRRMNFDSILNLRYTPQTSHVVINLKLFTSYLGGEHKLTIINTTWFRWLDEGSETVLQGGSVDLTAYHTPDIYWIRKLVD